MLTVTVIVCEEPDSHDIGVQTWAAQTGTVQVHLSACWRRQARLQPWARSVLKVYSSTEVVLISLCSYLNDGNCYATLATDLKKATLSTLSLRPSS